MAYAILPEPGTDRGPCATESRHTDCAQTREMALTVCPFCREPIGYGVKCCYTNTGDLAHFGCALEAAERAALPRCRHCSKPVFGGGGEHEDCRINEQPRQRA